MKLRFLLLVVLSAGFSLRGEGLAASTLAANLRGLSLDPSETYHVRDVRLSRGDIKIYLTEGTLSFTTPVAGHPLAAVFSTAGVELGDAEVLVMPTRRSERASLAAYAKTPNLDEHFDAALFLFTDNTYAEILHQLQQGTVRRRPEAVAKLAPDWNLTLRSIAGDLEIPLMASLLNQDPPDRGVFYGLIGGRTLHTFDVIYQPQLEESVEVGRVAEVNNRPRFQVWASFAPRHRQVPIPREPVTLSDFDIDATIKPDLTMAAVTRFRAQFHGSGLRAVILDISNRIKITAAKLDGKPVEVYQTESIRNSDDFEISPFLVVAPKPFVDQQIAEFEIHHQGSVIENAGNGVYFVQARNSWFPHRSEDLAKFDLTFRCPKSLQVVATGDLVSTEEIGSESVVHRKTQVPVRFAGFNLGEFVSITADRPPFHVECFANRALISTINAARMPDRNDPLLHPDSEQRLREMTDEVGAILDEYAKQWGPLLIRNIAISPIPGTFGQGFPGLIYLSMLSYLHESERPVGARKPIMDTFFSDLLLPHEIAHQWWGNLVSAADYRSEWLMEALANYGALERLEKHRGRAAVDAVMVYYKDELKTALGNGKPIEEVGPVDMGVRLRNSDYPDAWRVITYDKGTWILHMIRERLGDANFAAMLRQLTTDFRDKPISNEDFRKLASQHMPADSADRSLEVFFDTWVYGTGIPRLHLAPGQPGSGEMTLKQEGVDDAFTADVPVRIAKPGGDVVKWVRSSPDGTTFDVPRSGPVRVYLPAAGEFLYNE